MTQPNFQAMSMKELQRYVLNHRDDQAAFYAYVDKLNAEATWVEMPPIESVEDFQNYPEFVKRSQQHQDGNRIQ